MSMIHYGEALHQAMLIAMERDPSVFVMGIGVDDHKAVFGSTRGTRKQYSRFAHGVARYFSRQI